MDFLLEPIELFSMVLDSNLTDNKIVCDTGYRCNSGTASGLVDEHDMQDII